MLKAFAIAFMLSFAANLALAQRPSTLSMSCAEAAALVSAEGAIVLSTGRYTYDRFVAHVGFCVHGDQVVRARAPTADVRSCVIGYVCRFRQRQFRDD